MKVRIGYRKKRGVTRLVIDGDKGDGLGYAEAELIRQGRPSSFVPLGYERRGKHYRLSYAASGLRPLDEVIRLPLAPGWLAGMLVSFLTLMRECERGGLSRQRVSMDPHHILVDGATGTLRFVYVPLKSYVSAANSLHGTLIYLCEQARVPGVESPLRDTALDYLRRKSLVTSVGFEELLVDLGLVEPRSSGALPVEDDEWDDTDQLGERATHGHDFVGEWQASGGFGAAGGAAGGVVGGFCMAAHGADGMAAGGARWNLMRVLDGSSWDLSLGSYLVGRSRSCSICLPDVRGLGRRHACIEVGEQGCSVIDLDSKNGSYVDGRRLAPDVPCPIAEGATLAMGDERFLLRRC